MAGASNIEWCTDTWNPIVGCSVVSPGCTNCYAMNQAARIERMNVGRHGPHAPREEDIPPSVYDGLTKQTKGGSVWTGDVRLAREETLTAPLRWKRPRRIFVNSMGDLFHESVPDEWIDRVFAVMALAPQHTFQVLTKRSARMRAYATSRAQLGGNIGGSAIDTLEEFESTWSGNTKTKYPLKAASRRDEIIDLALGGLPNVWLGISAEDQRRADERVPDLLATPAAVRFVSAEPLLGPIDFRRWLFGREDNSVAISDSGWNPGGCVGWTPPLDWVIVGAESGHGARPMEQEWAQDIVDQCADSSVECFVKQLSGPNGRAVKDMNVFPPRLRVRQYPSARA